MILIPDEELAKMRTDAELVKAAKVKDDGWFDPKDLEFIALVRSIPLQEHCLSLITEVIWLRSVVSIARDSVAKNAEYIKSITT